MNLQYLKAERDWEEFDYDDNDDEHSSVSVDDDNFNPFDDYDKEQEK